MKEEFQHFIKSDHCVECGGEGFIDVEFTMNEMGEKEWTQEQCESCEELHQSEIRADRLCDEMKGN